MLNRVSGSEQVSFKSRFEKDQRVQSRVTEGPAPHGAQASRGDSEVDGGGGSEGAGWFGDVDEVRQIWRGKVVDFLSTTYLVSVSLCLTGSQWRCCRMG